MRDIQIVETGGEEMRDHYEEAKNAAIEGFEVELRIDATVRLGGKDSWDFVKPGASSSVRFDSIPSEQQLKVSMDFMSSEIIVPTLEDVLVQIQQKLRKARGGS